MGSSGNIFVIHEEEFVNNWSLIRDALIDRFETEFNANPNYFCTDEYADFEFLLQTESISYADFESIINRFHWSEIYKSMEFEEDVEVLDLYIDAGMKFPVFYNKHIYMYETDLQDSFSNMLPDVLRCTYDEINDCYLKVHIEEIWT